MRPGVATQDAIMRILASAPSGLTTRQVAERIPDAKPVNVAARLSRFAQYGWIERELLRGYAATGEHRRWSIWKPKERAHA